jgi:hypothetical protein
VSGAIPLHPSPNAPSLPAAIDFDGDAGDLAGGIRRQEEYRRRDLLRSSRSAEGTGRTIPSRSSRHSAS